MTVSNSRIRLVLSLVIGLASGLILTSGPSNAMNGPTEDSLPIRLIPLPKTAGDGASSLTPTAPWPSIPPLSEKNRIEISGIAPLSPEGIGTLDVALGGFPLDMWGRTDRNDAIRALTAMPTEALSPVRQDIARRLLLSTATPPAGPDGTNLLELRIHKLAVLGATQDLQSLIASLPPQAVSDTLRQALVDSFLIDGDTEAACQAIMDELPRSPSAYWQKAAAFCQFQSQQTAAATLTVALLREQNVNDADFFRLADQMAGLPGAALESLKNPSPLILAMIKAVKGRTPNDILTSKQPWMLRALALGAASESAARLSAVNQALMRGSLSDTDAARIYETETFTEASFTRPLSDIVEEAAPNAEALLWQRFRHHAKTPFEQAKIIHQAFTLARTRKTIPAMAILYANHVAMMPRSPELVWFADPAVRILLMSGKFDAAKAWLALVTQTQGAQAEQTKASLSPLQHLAGPLNDAMTDTTLEQWRTIALERAKLSPGSTSAAETVRRQQIRFLGLAHALGQPIPTRSWTDLWNAPTQECTPLPSLPVWQSLIGATLENHIGEATALALTALGTEPSPDVTDFVLVQAVDSLRRVGRFSDAQRIALEAAILSGL